VIRRESPPGTRMSLLADRNHGVMCGNPACRTIFSPAMIAYALGARTVRDNSTNSRTPPLGAALPRHPGLRTRHQWARQRIPGILHLAQRKCWRSAAGDPQTLAAPVAGIVEMPSAPILRNVKLRQTMRRLKARVVRVSPIDGWNLCGLQFARPLI